MAVIVGSVATLGVASTALAEPDAGTVADDVDRTGFYVEPGAEADAEAVDDTAADLANQGLFPGLVVLAEDPPGGSTAYATEVFDELVATDSDVRTVVVVSPETVGVDSDEYDGDTVDGALDASIDEFQSSPAAGFAALYDELSGEPQGGSGTASASTDDSGDGGGFGVVLLVILVAVVLIGGFLWWRSRRRASSSDRAILDEARYEVKAQLSVVADRILASEAQASTELQLCRRGGLVDCFEPQPRVGHRGGGAAFGRGHAQGRGVRRLRREAAPRRTAAAP